MTPPIKQNRQVRRAFADVVVTAVIPLALFLLAANLEVFAHMRDVSGNVGAVPMSDVALLLGTWLLSVLGYGWRKWVHLSEELAWRANVQSEQAKLIEQLQHALANIRTLRGLVPMCAACKRIRDTSDHWHQLEVYLRDHSHAEFTHGLCPTCTETYFPEEVPAESA